MICCSADSIVRLFLKLTCDHANGIHLIPTLPFQLADFCIFMLSIFFYAHCVHGLCLLTAIRWTVYHITNHSQCHPWSLLIFTVRLPLRFLGRSPRGRGQVPCYWKICWWTKNWSWQTWTMRIPKAGPCWISNPAGGLWRLMFVLSLGWSLDRFVW